jgi:pantetheine-phosphate adenylyltransferase
VVEQAVALFGDLVIGVMHNPDKDTSLFTADERVAMIRESVAHLGKQVCVEKYAGLTVDAALGMKAKLIVKSARSGADFEVEQQMAQMNVATSSVETVLLFSRAEHSYISSRYIRQFTLSNGTIKTPMVTKPVQQALNAKRTKGAS